MTAQMNIRTLLLVLILFLNAGVAHAVACSATISPINFGAISVRAGAVNQTSGVVTITCTGLIGVAVGVCIKVGSGSGGSAGNNSPRYMVNATGDTLHYELRPNGNGAINGTWNQQYYLSVLSVGTVSWTVPIFASITSSTVAVDTGSYSSTFSGVSHASISYGVASCAVLGTENPIPDFSVSADVVPSCELDVTAMNFGNLNTQISAPIDQTATVNVRCTDSTNYSVTLSQGSGGGTGPTDRRMKNGSYELRYGLYQDAARSAPWGESVSNDVNSTGIGSNQAFTVYGRIPPSQSAYFGTYTDSVVVTVNY